MNPYIDQQANQISGNMTRNFNQNVLPGINSGAIAAGGFGGSRQALAQSMGMRGLNDSIGQAQTNLYSNAYNTDQSNQLQRDLQSNQLASNQSIASMQNDTQRIGLQNNFDVAKGNLGLSQYQADQNFWNQNRQMDLSQYGLGLQAAQAGQQGLANQGNQLFNLGLTQEQAGWAPIQNLGQGLSNFTGLNQSQSQTTPGASGWQNALAGGLTAAQLWQLLSKA